MRFITFVVVLGIAGASLHAQERGGRQGRQNRPAPAAEGVSPAEVQRMFDSYALMQAQEQLKIKDEVFPKFLSRFKALQDVRRKALQDRTRLIVELRQMVNQAQPDDAKLKELLKAVHDLETRAQGDVKKAYESIDEVLDVRQQAKFRVFEENMERRKLDLVMRARASRNQANRNQANQNQAKPKQ
jgi:Spy/CpxP family protein refolding chaperone